MYNITKHCSHGAARPAPSQRSCDLYTPLSDEVPHRSPSFLDYNYSSNSSVSPSSFVSLSEDFNSDQNDALLTQIINEYSNEEFPTFENLIDKNDNFNINLDDFFNNIDSFNYDFEINESIFIDDFQQNLSENFNDFSSNYQNLEQILLKNEKINQRSNFKIYKITNLPKQSLKITNLPKQSLKIYKNFEDLSKRKRKIDENKSEFDFLDIKKFKKNHLSTDFCEESSKIGNREAAFRYRQKMKLKINEDESELNESVREMKEAKRSMLEMRRQMNTYKSLVRDLLAQHAAL